VIVFYSIGTIELTLRPSNERSIIWEIIVYEGPQLLHIVGTRAEVDYVFGVKDGLQKTAVSDMLNVGVIWLH